MRASAPSYCSVGDGLGGKMWFPLITFTRPTRLFIGRLGADSSLISQVLFTLLLRTTSTNTPYSRDTPCAESVREETVRSRHSMGSRWQGRCPCIGHTTCPHCTVPERTRPHTCVSSHVTCSILPFLSDCGLYHPLASTLHNPEVRERYLPPS